MLLESLSCLLSCPALSFLRLLTVTSLYVRSGPVPRLTASATNLIARNPEQVCASIEPSSVRSAEHCSSTF